MKKVYMILSVLLILFAGYVYSFRQKVNGLKETEAALVQETESKKNELQAAKENFSAKEAELTKVSEENKEELEELEVWQARTAELQELPQN